MKSKSTTQLEQSEDSTIHVKKVHRGSNEKSKSTSRLEHSDDSTVHVAKLHEGTSVKSKSATELDHLDDSAIHVKKVHRRSSVKSKSKDPSVDVQKLSRSYQEVEKTAKRISIEKETDHLNDTQTKSTASVVHIRRIQRARDGDTVNESTNKGKPAALLLSNKNNSSSTTENRTSLNTSVKVRTMSFLRAHLFLSIE